MQVKLFLGIMLLIVGLVVALAGVVSIRGPEDEVRNNPGVAGDQNAVVGDQNEPERDVAASMVLPVIGGLAIAAGATLIGLGMGAFRHPKIVPPDSRQAEKAATTRPLS